MMIADTLHFAVKLSRLCLQTIKRQSDGEDFEDVNYCRRRGFPSSKLWNIL